MRIIKGKDYYDSANAYGIDPGVVFVRDEFEIPSEVIDRLKLRGNIRVKLYDLDDYNKQTRGGSATTKAFMSLPYMLRSKIKTPNASLEVGPLNVIFCGKHYVGMKIVDRTDILNVKEYYFWDEEKLQAWCDENKVAYMIDSNYYEYLPNASKTVLFRVTEFSEAQKKLLIDNRIVVAVYDRNKLSLHQDFWKQRYTTYWFANNDQLKSVKFHSAVDPYQAHQEISMWIGMYASAGPEIVNIVDNDIKIAKHGFDKMSFRKPKS